MIHANLRAPQPAQTRLPVPYWLDLALHQEFGAAAPALVTGWALRFGDCLDAAGAWCVPDRHSEYHDLLQLLLDHAVARDAHRLALARWLALSCLGDNHLWQDLGLAERPALTVLLQTHFPALRAKNAGNMRWKKFFYRQLCAQDGGFVCRSPSCSECSEYRECFGPEDPHGS